jgi:hypothetical protein
MKSISSTAFRVLAAAIVVVTIGTTLAFGSAGANRRVTTMPAPDREINPSNPVTDQIIVKYRDGANVAGSNAPDGAARMQALNANAGETLTYARPMSGDAHVLRLPAALPIETVEAIASKLAALPDIEYAEPDYMMSPTLSPNDPSYGAQ